MSETPLLTKKDLTWSECNIQIEAGNTKSFEATESAKLHKEKEKKQKARLKGNGNKLRVNLSFQGIRKHTLVVMMRVVGLH